jgi:hypothetical protein
MNSMTDKPLCAITGAGGYVGGCLKDYFTRHGWEILELTRQPKPGARAVAFQLGADISPPSLAGVTALVHCAYDFKPLRSSFSSTTRICPRSSNNSPPKNSNVFTAAQHAHEETGKNSSRFRGGWWTAEDA